MTPYTYSWAPAGGTGATATALCAGTYTATITDATLTSITRTFTLVQPPVLQILDNFVAQPGICGASSQNSGAISVNVTGGTPTGTYPFYTFDWSPGTPTGDGTPIISQLGLGTYTLTVTDTKGCVVTKTYNLTTGQGVTATQSQVNLTCNGVCTGSATVVASGGIAPYTYSWSPSGGSGATASNLCAITYTCTITDAGSCSITKTFAITQPPAIIITPISQTNVSCNGGNNGAAQVTASGGTGTLTYNWTPGNPTGDGTGSVTGLLAQVYTVTVTDANSCTRTRTFNITQPPALTATQSQTNVSCNGGSSGAASVNVSGGVPSYSYNWTPGNPTGDGTPNVTGLTAGTYTVGITDANGCSITRTFTVTQPPALTATGVQTNIACNGDATGSATVSASGGTPGYTYSWAPSGGTAATASNLVADIYTVTVTDANSCTTTQTFALTQPPALSAVPVSQTNVSCNGGSNGAASVSVSGGSPTYTYNWTPGSPPGDGTASVTGLTAGIYTVTVTDANGCSTAQTFNITQPPPITTSGSQTDVSCAGGSNGSATVSPSGGQPGYTYAWAPSGGTAATASGLTAGTYTVTVTDANGCTTTRSYAVTEPPPLIAATAGQTNVTCAGGSNGSATVSASGGAAGYIYSWSPSGGTAATATGLAAGTYTVIVTDANGCSAMASYNITEPPPLTTSAAVTNISCNGAANGSATVTPAGGAGGYTYSWAPAGGTSSTATSLGAGTYTVTVTDANSCTTNATVTITEPPPLTVAISSTNPSCNATCDGSATAVPSGGTGSYTYAWAPGGQTTQTVTNLCAGTYTATVTDANGCSTSQTVALISPSAISITPSQTNVSCFNGSNGSATVTASGGTGALAYAWAPSGGTAATASALTAGTYTVTITDANACAVTQTFNITQPPALQASIAHTDPLCSGQCTGTATVPPTGGTGSYTFAWTPGGQTTATATNLCAGTYTATITDTNGCAITQTVTIAPPPPLTTTGSQTDSCPSASTGSATVVASGGMTPYTYAWAPSGGTAATASGLAAGTYTATVTDGNACTTSRTFNIIDSPPIVIDPATSQTNVSCNGANDGVISVVATGGSGSLAYAWAPSGGSAATASSLGPGTYTVTITDTNACAITRTFAITQPAPLVANGTSSGESAVGACDGTASVAPSGGTAPFSVLWSPGGSTSNTVTGLCGPSATATITDSRGCTATFTATINGPSADVSVGITAATNPANAGTSVSFTIVASTTADSPNATLTGSTPGGTTFASLAVPAGWSCTTPASGSSGPFTCTSALLTAATPATFTLIVDVPPLFGSGSINASVSVSAAVNDALASNNNATTSAAIVTPARLIAVKTATAGTVNDPVVYTIAVQNTGAAAQLDDPASDELVDVLPPQLALVSATATSGTVTTTGNTVRWNGALASGATVTITIDASVLPAVTPGTSILNQAQVRYDADGNGTSDTTDGSRPSPVAAPGATSAVVTAPVAGVPLLDISALIALIAILGLIAVMRLRG